MSPGLKRQAHFQLVPQPTITSGKTWFPTTSIFVQTSLTFRWAWYFVVFVWHFVVGCLFISDTTGRGAMRCASGARYAIALKMALLSLVCLHQVPDRAAADLSSTPRPKPTSHFRLSTSSSTTSLSSDTAHGRAYRTENVNSESRTPGTTTTLGLGSVVTADKQVSDRGIVSYSPRPLEDGKMDKGSSGENVCDVGRCDDIMARKQGMCGCNVLNKKKILKSGVKKRSVLNRDRPLLTWTLALTRLYCTCTFVYAHLFWQDSDRYKTIDETEQYFLTSIFKLLQAITVDITFSKHSLQGH